LRLTTPIAHCDRDGFLELNRGFALAVNCLDKLARVFRNSPGMKTSIPAVLIIFALACFALVQNTHAVSPPPDGDYPGGNTAEGENALSFLTTGTFNTAVGWRSLLNNDTGRYNTAVGAGCLFINMAEENTATGTGALFLNLQGGKNTATGAFALFSNSNGTANTAVGSDALPANTSGGQNTALGQGAGFNQTTGSGNVYIGVGVPGVAGESNSCYIASIFNQVPASGIPVLINASHKLGTTTSSKRFKQDIKSMGNASEALFSLKPVTFRYKKEIDAAGTSQFGLVAEDVEKVDPDLIVRDKEGKPYSVRYEQVNAMLLNEFLKEHRKNEEQQATIAQLKYGMEALTATVKEQAAQIQKVSARLDLSKTAPQTVLNSQ
jgi:hypothetical protein